MTVTSTTARNDYVGSGSSGPFAYTFKVFAPLQLIVYTTDANGITSTLTYLTDYTVAGAGNDVGGTITLTNALAVGFVMSIQRNPAFEQLSDFRNQGEFFPASYEDALDYLMMVCQFLENQDLSAVRLALTVNPALFSTLLPANLKAGNALVVRADGLGFDQAAMSAATLSAWNATNNIFLDAYTSGFTPGVTTQLTLTHNPGSANNVSVSFDISGTPTFLQGDDFSVSGTTITFVAAIPVGTTRVEIKYLLTYQVNTAAANNVTYAPASGPGTDVQTELRSVDASIVTLNTNVTKLMGEVLGLHLADFGVIGNGTTDDTVALQAALTAGAAQKLVVYGHAMVVKVTSAVTMSGPGLVFDYAGQGTAGTPGILISGSGYTALTVSGSPQIMNLTAYGTGNTANGIFFNNPIRSAFINVRVYNLKGFGVRIDQCFDCVFNSISVELIDASTSAFPAFSVNDGGGTSNQSHILRLQVENCTGPVIFISPNSIDLVVDTIHSERAVCPTVTAGAFVVGINYKIITVGTTDYTLIGASANTVGLSFTATGVGAGTGTAAAIAWLLGGGSCVFNESRFNATSGTPTLWLRSSDSTYLSTRAESTIAVDLEAVSGTSLTLVSPNFAATTREFPSQSGMLVVHGGYLATWSGNRGNLYGCFAEFLSGARTASGGNWLLNGNLKLILAGNERYTKQGTNGTVGRAVLVGGTVTVATTAVGTNAQEIQLTYAAVANVAHVGTLYIANVVAGVSFDIKSTNGADDSQVSWEFCGRA